MKITIRLTAEMEETLKKMVEADQEFVAEHNARVAPEQHLVAMDLEIAAIVALEDGLKLASQKETDLRGSSQQDVHAVKNVLASDKQQDRSDCRVSSDKRGNQRQFQTEGLSDTAMLHLHANEESVLAESQTRVQCLLPSKNI